MKLKVVAETANDEDILGRPYVLVATGGLSSNVSKLGSNIWSSLDTLKSIQVNYKLISNYQLIFII